MFNSAAVEVTPSSIFSSAAVEVTAEPLIDNASVSSVPSISALPDISSVAFASSSPVIVIFLPPDISFVRISYDSFTCYYSSVCNAIY